MRSCTLQRRSKYDFRLLEIGDSMIVYGPERGIRTAASMWGTRYGIWLAVAKRSDGGFVVTRLEAPPKPRGFRKMDLDLERRFKKLDDGMRTIALLVIDLKRSVQQLLDEKA